MDDIEILLTRGVDTVYPSRAEFEKVLRSGKKLTLYQGFDPTGTQLHIGHAVGIRKLKQFQDLGHSVVFLVGDGTGQAGDPSGKSKARGAFLTQEKLRQNGKDYVMQAGKIVNFDGPNPVKILYNGDWLNELKLVDILSIAEHFSVQQLIERDMFQERIKRNESINLREFLYPLLQGYDSVAMNVDLEVGGSDQTFNMLAGRTLVKAMLGKEKFVLTTPLLTDAQGRKIGKTEGNVIAITDPPNDLYAKILSLGDDSIIPCFTLLTDVPMPEIAAMERGITQGDNPMTHKKRLAFEITRLLNSEGQATEAQKQFEIAHQKGDLATADLPTMTVSTFGGGTITDQLVMSGLAPSRSEAKRLIEQGAIEINSQAMRNPHDTPKLTAGDIIKVGKKKLIKLQ